MISSEDLKAVVATTIAEKIIAGLDDEHRKEFLVQAVASSLKDYQVKSAIEKAVADKALEVAKKLLAAGEWDHQISVAVREGFTRYVTALPGAIEAVLVEAIHGKIGDNSYDRMPGAILKHFRKVE